MRYRFYFSINDICMNDSKKWKYMYSKYNGYRNEDLLSIININFFKKLKKQIVDLSDVIIIDIGGAKVSSIYSFLLRKYIRKYIVINYVDVKSLQYTQYYNKVKNKMFFLKKNFIYEFDNIYKYLSELKGGDNDIILIDNGLFHVIDKQSNGRDIYFNNICSIYNLFNKVIYLGYFFRGEDNGIYRKLLSEYNGGIDVYSFSYHYLKNNIGGIFNDYEIEKSTLNEEPIWLFSGYR